MLAAAGLERLGVERARRAPLDFVPAPGQGTLALEIRADDDHTRASIRFVEPRAYLRGPARRAGRRARIGSQLSHTCGNPRAKTARFAASWGCPTAPPGWPTRWRPRTAKSSPGGCSPQAQATCWPQAEAMRVTPRRRRAAATRRIVFLVGAGPGDPGLLHRSARSSCSASADVVLYDRLIPPEALRHARPEAELVYVGKQGGGPQMPQEEIDRLLVEHGRSGKRVVRLKGGDPLVFGRGGEEALRLREAGHRVRDRARHHRRGGRARLRRHPRHPPRPGERRGVRHRPRGPRQAGVGARLGGARALPRHARLLHGRPRAAADRREAAGRGALRREPVAVIERGTLPGQRTLVGDARRRRPARAAERHPRARGDARRRRSPPCATSWPGSSAARCTASTVAVTRARAQASPLAARLRDLGADGDRGARDPHRAAARGGPRPQRLRPARRVEPQRRARALRRSTCGTRATWPACAWPRWAPAPRGR